MATGSDLGGRPDWRRRILVAAGVAFGAVAIGAVLGLVLAGRSAGPTRSAAIDRLPSLPVGALVQAPDARPEPLDEPTGLGSLHAGLALLARDEVDEVRTVDGRRRAPAGSRLIAFRLGDWACEEQPCASWRSLAPTVVIDGQPRDLPDDGDVFVVVVPPGSGSVDLVVDADGFRQSISLTTGEAGPGNIALLAERDTERKVPLADTFTVAERTSVPLDDGAGGRTDVFQRQVRVEYAQRRFFLHGAVPSSPANAFLVINAYYAYAGRPDRYVLGPGEVTFVDADGQRYQALDLDPAADKGLLGFEVPATVDSGTLEIGGASDKVSTTGVPYVSTLEGRRLPITVP